MSASFSVIRDVILYDIPIPATVTVQYASLGKARDNSDRYNLQSTKSISDSQTRVTIWL